MLIYLFVEKRKNVNSKKSHTGTNTLNKQRKIEVMDEQIEKKRKEMYAEKSRDTNCVIWKVSKLKRKYVKHGKMEFYCYFCRKKCKA